MRPSYVHGASATPLLGQTIGENLDRAVERWGDREALVSCHQDVRYTYAELGEAVDRLARALLADGLEPGDRLGIWSPNCAEWVLVQYATAKAGIVLVNVNPAYRTSELEYALRQSGCRALIAAPAFKTSDYAAMIESVRGDLPDARARRAARLARVGGAGRAAPDQDVELPVVPVRRRDQHPVHERHHGLPQGRHAQPPQHPQQRLLRGRGLPLHRGGPRLHPRALLPLLRHGHGQPRLHHARRLHGDPGGGVRARGDAARRAGGALHLALRRADDVHRRARAPATSRSSTSPACARGSWPARRARSTRCAAWSTRCTWRR